MRCECCGRSMVYYRPAVYTPVILYRQLGNKPGRVLGTPPAVIYTFYSSSWLWSFAVSHRLHSRSENWAGPVRAPGNNAPLIHLLISALYTLLLCLSSPLTSFIDLITYFSLLICFVTYLFPLRIGPLCFQAGGRKRR